MAARERPTAARPVAHAPSTVVVADALVVAGPIAPADLVLLCGRVRALLQGGARDIDCDVEAVRHPDVETVEALARLQLAASRIGGRIWLLRAPPELRELITLVGLEAVLPLRGDLPVEPRREPEEREERGGVEEGADADDPIG